MSAVEDIETAMRTAITTTLGITADVYSAASRAHAIGAATRKPGIVLVHEGRTVLDKGPLGQRVKNKISYRWTIAIVIEDYRSPTSGLSDLLAISDVLDGLRSIKLTTVGEEPVYLTWPSGNFETFEVPSGRAEVGGPLALLQTWETTEVRV